MGDAVGTPEAFAEFDQASPRDERCPSEWSGVKSFMQACCPRFDLTEAELEAAIASESE